MKREKEWVGRYGGGCDFKWGPGEASLGVTPEWSRGSEAGGYLGKPIVAGSVTEADSHQLITKMPTGCQDLTGMIPL